MKWLAHFSAWLLLGLSLPVLAAPPSSIQLGYDIYKDSLHIGHIDETYTRDKDGYTLNSTTTPLGLLAVFKPEKIFMHSSGQVNSRGLRPWSFRQQREGDTENRADFDWSAGKLTLSQGSQSSELPLPEATQDRLSAMYQFMFLSLHETVDFPMTNGRKLDSYHYGIIRTEKLKTALGELDTLYLDSQPKPGESRTEIWLATKHHALPCKMIITDADGGRLTQILSTLVIQP